jgi:hypothetical protein
VRHHAERTADEHTPPRKGAKKKKKKKNRKREGKPPTNMLGGGGLLNRTEAGEGRTGKGEGVVFVVPEHDAVAQGFGYCRTRQPVSSCISHPASHAA